MPTPRDPWCDRLQAILYGRLQQFAWPAHGLESMRAWEAGHSLKALAAMFGTTLYRMQDILQKTVVFYVDLHANQGKHVREPASQHILNTRDARTYMFHHDVTVEDLLHCRRAAIAQARQTVQRELYAEVDQAIARTMGKYGLEEETAGGHSHALEGSQ